VKLGAAILGDLLDQFGSICTITNTQKTGISSRSDSPPHEANINGPNRVKLAPWSTLIPRAVCVFGRF